MALPSDKISTTLVGQTLGSGSRDVGTLCTHPNINKWSKGKPVRFNKVNGLVDSDRRSVHQGFDISFFNTLQEIYNFYKSNPDYSFSYLRPRGSVYNEPYRLGDFRGYKHDAIHPYILHQLQGNVYYNDDIITLWIQNTLGLTSENVTLEDLNLGSGLYFASLLSDASAGLNAPYKFVISSNPVELDYNSGFITTANIPLSGFSYGSADVFCMLVLSTDGVTVSKYIPIEGGYLGTIGHLLSTIIINVYSLATFYGPGYNVNTTVSIYNGYNYAIMVENPKLYARFKGRTPEDAAMAGEVDYNFGLESDWIDIPANSWYTKEIDFENILAGMWDNYGGASMFFRCSNYPILNSEWTVKT